MGAEGAGFVSVGVAGMVIGNGLFLREPGTQAKRRVPVNPGNAALYTGATLPLYFWIGRTPTGLVLSARIPSTAARAAMMVVMMQTLWA